MRRCKKEVRVLAGCVVVGLVIILFTNTWDVIYPPTGGLIIRQKDLILTPPSTPGKYDVILSSYMNSGSRFTGRLLGYKTDDFYFYEPLWKFTLWEYFKPPDSLCSATVGSCRKVTTEEINKFWVDDYSDKTEPIMHNMPRSTNVGELFLHVLSSVYTCRLRALKNVVQDRVQDHASYGGPSWMSYRKCIMSFKPKSVCLDRLEDLCKNRTHRVIKVLRTSLTVFRPLLETNPRLRLVHLVRDPRAIVNSRSFSRGYPIYGYKPNNSLEMNLCNKMSEDYIEAMNLIRMFPDRVKIIYYEDLISNLHTRLKQLFTYLGMRYNATEISNLAKIQVNWAPPEKGIDFAKDRQENNAAWWRKYIQGNELRRVDKACYQVYRQYGYRQLSEKQIRDLSVATLNIPKHLSL